MKLKALFMEEPVDFEKKVQAANPGGEDCGGAGSSFGGGCMVL